MHLSYLLKDILELPAEADRDISHLFSDSRLIKPNSLFIAVKGWHANAQDYIPAAIEKGAIAVLLESSSPKSSLEWQQQIPLIAIPNLSQQLGFLAARFYDYPANKLRMIGVTGTSGKTSCTHFIADALQALHIPCGLIGTLGSGFLGALKETGFTTPDAITLQANLAQLLQQGAKAISMEVSSHSIDQGRINGIDFEIGIFTNLSQDHLDYHVDMQTYAAVKRKFLADFPTKNIILNADDEYGNKWLTELSSTKQVFAYAMQKTNLPSKIPLIFADKINLSLQGIQAHIQTPWGDGDLNLPLIGQFNLSNVLAVLTALGVYGIPFKDILAKLNQLKAVPGRMQMLGGNNKPLVVIDYAHKPDALEKALHALRSHTPGKLICVFGCGGERDRSKRPLMAKIAETIADQVILTNDNPRNENPETIAAEIMQGFSNPKGISVELDRSKAIQKSIQWATGNDCILIAGKGAEHYQQIGDDKLPFDDVQKVREYL